MSREGLSQRIRSQRIVAELGPQGHHLVDDAGPVVQVGEVGPEDDVRGANLRHDRAEHRLAGLEGNPALPLEVLRRRPADTGAHLAGELRVLDVVEPPEPVRQPPAPRLEDAHPQRGMSFEDASFDQGEQRHHHLDRVRAGMLAEMGAEAIRPRGGDVRVGALVEEDGEPVVLARGPEPRVRRIAQRAALHRVGSQDDGAQAVAERLLEVAHHRLGIVAREEGGAQEPVRRERAEVPSQRL